MSAIEDQVGTVINCRCNICRAWISGGVIAALRPVKQLEVPGISIRQQLRLLVADVLVVVFIVIARALVGADPDN